MINQTQVTVVFTLLVIMLASFVRERRFMEKQLLTALLVLLLLAPQTGLEAKGRHHGVKDSHHDSKKHHHKSKKHSKKHRHSHHLSSRKFYKFARATNAELELLNQAVSDIDMRVNTLESQDGEVPDETLIQLREDVDLNRKDIDINMGDIDINMKNIGINESGVVLNMRDIQLIREDIQNIHDLIATLHPPPPPEIVFSGDFLGGVAPSGDIVEDWNEFTGTAIGMSTPFSSIEIRSLSDGGETINARAICGEPTKATGIADALSMSTETSLDCGGKTWSVTNCNGSIELRAGFGAGAITCDCKPNAIVLRPLIGNENWGGAGLPGPNPTCGDPDQRLEVILIPNK
jgi:hypothetical protein